MEIGNHKQIQSIELEDVGFEISATKPLLQAITTRFVRGRFYGIVGTNGSGKSTLAQLLNQSLQPTSGHISYDRLATAGKGVCGINKIKQSIVLVRSDPESQFVTSCVYDEIAFALQAAHLPLSEIKERVASCLQMFDLHTYKDQHPLFLSAGEQVRVLVAAAVARQPDFLILDEIGSMVDSKTRYIIFHTLVSLMGQTDFGLIYLTHRLEDLELATQIILLNDGQIVKKGTPNEIWADISTHKYGVEIPLFNQMMSHLEVGKRKLVSQFVKQASENM